MNFLLLPLWLFAQIWYTAAYMKTSDIAHQQIEAAKRFKVNHRRADNTNLNTVVKNITFTNPKASRTPLPDDALYIVTDHRFVG